MNIQVHSFTLGPIQNNTYLLVARDQKQAAIIDPAFDSEQVWQFCQTEELEISDIFCTHAHFDHIAGINELVPHFSTLPHIWLHPDDLPLWQANGGAKNFGIPFEIAAQPNQMFYDQQHLTFGGEDLAVFLTPGHTRGHVVLYLQALDIVFSGDLIFRQSVGRTDLPGGNHQQLLHSIETYIKPLPDQTRILSGHGPETTVAYEKKHNPFL